MADREPTEGNARPESGRNGAPVPPPGVSQSANGPFSNPYVPPEGNSTGAGPGSGESADQGAAGTGPSDNDRRPTQSRWGENADGERQAGYRQPENQSAPQWGTQPSGQSSGLFGPNGRWLWFAGGVLFALIGVLIALLFNMRKPAAERYDAIRFAAWGMLVGFVLEIITLILIGGVEALFPILGIQETAPSGGSVF